MSTLLRLHAVLAAVLPIDGVGVRDAAVPLGPGNVRVTPDSAQAQAQTIIDTFDWSAGAQMAWERQQARGPAIDALATSEVSSVLMRALLAVLLDEINTLRGAVIPALLPRTLTQLRVAIQTRIDSGAMDT